MAGNLSGCQKENQFDCLKSTGTQVADNRMVAPFTHIRVFDNIEVELVKDSVHFIEIHAGDNLLPNIETKVENGVLTLHNNNKCNWVRSYKHTPKAVVHVATPRRILHDGYQTVRSRGTLVQDSIDLNITDAGDFDLTLQSRFVRTTQYETGNITLKGTAQLFSFENYGLGKVYAAGLAADTVYGHVAGQGDNHVRATKVVGATISGAGNVYYYGSPEQAGVSGPGPGQFIHLP